MPAGSRAQTETIGSLLLVAVVVTTVATFAGFYLSDLHADESGPVAEFNASVSSTVNVTHLGGDTIERDELRVIVANESSRENFTVAEGTITSGDTDGLFEPGEEVGNATALTGSVRVLVVHEPSNTLLYDGRQNASG